MQAVILAGGLGTRLRPITYKIPKHMVKISGKPFLEHLIKMLKRNGIDEIVLCVGYLWEKIADYFGDGNKFGVKIEYSVEKNLLGTGGALKLAEKYIKDDFFVIYGDSYLELDYKKMMHVHKRMKKEGLLAAYNNKSKSFANNNIEIDGRGYVTKYDKEGRNYNAKYVDAGVSVFKKSVLGLIQKNKKVSLEEDIFPKLIKRWQLFAFKSRNMFYDIGTMQRLKIFKEVRE
ncbi:nucleotidyltransferase family protein [Candidatus Woesearchaeota archaeon]|nr:nucleotidyltransferase family protein [Candidatus Woesearchaeota archaeon]